MRAMLCIAVKGQQSTVNSHSHPSLWCRVSRYVRHLAGSRAGPFFFPALEGGVAERSEVGVGKTKNRCCDWCLVGSVFPPIRPRRSAKEPKGFPGTFPLKVFSCGSPETGNG